MTGSAIPKQPIHKAYLISSIKACIPTPLDLDKLNYNSWSSLLKHFCKTYEVHHHLDAPSTTTTSTVAPLHESNDSLVVMWIYSTISPKLVDMIVDDDTTAHGVWKRLKGLFHDNKDARSKADHIANLGSPVKDPSLVTYAINGVRSKYPKAARIIRRREKAPIFDEMQSMMILEKGDMLQQSNGDSYFHNKSSFPTALVESIMGNDRANTGLVANLFMVVMIFDHGPPPL
ncbi:hypothetical protein Tco_0366470 [Tanacetum coccineum]